jgi:hypothetical protein
MPGDYIDAHIEGLRDPAAIAICWLIITTQSELDDDDVMDVYTTIKGAFSGDDEGSGGNY